jgi:hypothetical protein
MTSKQHPAEKQNAHNNVAFKVTWLYATKGDFEGPCNARGRALNTRRGGGNWCRQEGCLCNILDRANSGRELDLSLDPCSEAKMFDGTWNFNTGGYHKGSKMGEPIPIRHANVGRFAFLTSRKHEMVEDQRIIIAAYQIGAVGLVTGGLHDHPRYEVSALAYEQTQIRVRDLKRAPKFWDFYQNSSGPPAWGSMLFRYLSDEQAKEMYDAVRIAGILEPH